MLAEIADPRRLAQAANGWPRDAAIGRLGQVCDRWICTACLRFARGLEEQDRAGSGCGYPAWQAGYSRDLLPASGAQAGALSGRILDRTRSRLDIPAIRAIVGLKSPPRCGWWLLFVA